MPNEQKNSTHPLFPDEGWMCAVYHNELATARLCEMATGYPDNNATCCIVKCRSPLRMCRACVDAGHRKGMEFLVVNPDTDLCARHEANRLQLLALQSEVPHLAKQEAEKPSPRPLAISGESVTPHSDPPRTPHRTSKPPTRRNSKPPQPMHFQAAQNGDYKGRTLRDHDHQIGMFRVPYYQREGNGHMSKMGNLLVTPEKYLKLYEDELLGWQHEKRPRDESEPDPEEVQRKLEAAKDGYV